MKRLDRERAKILSWDDLQKGMEISLPLVITQTHMEMFANLSGDHNPLHLDDNFARRKGFPGRIVYGGLIVAHISRLVSMHLPGQDSIWVSLEISFHSPLMVGQEAELKGSLQSKSDSTRMLELSLTLISRGKTLATGSAEVIVKE